MMKKQQTINMGQSNAAMGGLEWEMRPGGMLVQKRNLDSSKNSNSYQNVNPIIRIRVKFNSNLHEIQINPHSSFGELKKMLAGPTGLHPQDQKLMFKEKERDSRQYLDIIGVKDGSRLVLMEDLLSQERRFLELRRNSTMEKAMKSVAEVTMEVDKLGSQVASVEAMVSKGRIMADKELLNLTELLMSQLIKLDGIVADGDVRLRRKTQVVRVQRYIETIDKLKAQNEIMQQRKKLMTMGENAAKFQRNVGGQVPKYTNFASQQVFKKFP
ncbi:hypothetical protein V2J09_004686 [Rumex salicifolius]